MLKHFVGLSLLRSTVSTETPLSAASCPIIFCIYIKWDYGSVFENAPVDVISVLVRTASMFDLVV